MAELSEPTEAEVDHLAGVITEARLNHGISAGGWSLARFILAAGYRRMPEPQPVRHGECRACGETKPLTAEGAVEEHDDERRRCLCIGSRVTPFRIVEPKEAVADA